MKSKKLYLTFLILAAMAQHLLAQPFNVTINTTTIPPANPVIRQYIDAGNVKASVLYNLVGAGPMQVYIQGRIECLSPTPFTISVRSDYAQQGMVTLTPGVPFQLNPAQVLGAFGGFNDANLVTTGVSLSSLKDANNNINLPAGTYRICFVARQPDPASGQPGPNASDPNLGCATFTIPNTQPVNGVTVNTLVIPPVNATINAAVLSGNIKSTLQFNGPVGSSAQVKVFGRIERLSPSPFTISLNASYIPPQTVSLSPGVPLQLSVDQMTGAFGNFSESNLALSGITWNDIRNANNTITLPEGTYRICFSAKYISPTGGIGGNASDPALGCATFTLQNMQPVNGVTVNTLVIPPVNASINSSVLSGNIKSTLQFNGPVGSNPQVKVFGKIERLSPSPFTISVNSSYIPPQTVTLAPGVPTQLSVDQILSAFGNFGENNLALSGIGWSDIRDVNNRITLPDGTYRICFYAKYISPTGGIGGNASDPTLGCATFGICAGASAPQFTQPVNNFNITSTMPVVKRTTPVIFAWTAPSSTCGGQMGVIAYELEIHELLPGQTSTDAINNPPLFIRRQIPTTTFPFDTLLNNNVLQNGKRYAIRVRAMAPAGAGLVQKIDNNGYSRIEVFQYGDTSTSAQPIVPNGLNNPPTPPANQNGDENKQDENKEQKENKENETPTVSATPGDCGLTMPSEKTLIDKNVDLKNAKIKIGEFDLTSKDITRNNDDTYKGSGTIEWKPFGLPSAVLLAVKFDKIKINKNKEVIDGTVMSSTDFQQFQSADLFSELKGMPEKAIDQLSDQIDKLVNNNTAPRVLSKITGQTPTEFPIGLDNEEIGASGSTATFAIMNMVFSPKGATMSVLMSVNITDAHGWLSLAGTGFCVHPTGVSFKQGTLLLPNDRYFDLGSGDDSLVVKFKGCPNADSTKGTYVTWGKDGLSDIVAHGEIMLPKSAVVREDKDGNPLDSAVTAELLFRFHKWDDWVAAISSPNFQIKGVKGFSFSPGTIFYDHSVKQNAPGFELPEKYTGFKDQTFEGLYIKDLTVKLPSDFKTFNNGDTRTSFSAKDFVIDSKGVSVHVLGAKVIDLSKGDLGGWAFSMDTVEFVVQQNTFQSGRMKGQILMPISKTPLGYSGDLHVSDKDSSLQYAFIVKPEDQMKIDLWAATMELDKNSGLEIKKDSLGAAVSFILNGTIGFDLGGNSVPISLPGLKFETLGIANRDPKTKEKKFWFSQGNWSFTGLGSNSNEKALNEMPDNGIAAVFGPNAYEQGAMGRYAVYTNKPYTGDKDQGKVSGFPISINNITPYTDMTDLSNLKLGVRFDVNVNVGFGDASVLSATTNLAVYGTLNASFTDRAPQINPPGASVDIDSVKVKGGVGPVKVDGMLVFYKQNDKFGNGVKGHVSAMFPTLKAGIEATAQFGNVDNYNYWYVDASATFPTIPVVGPIGINGFGGGAYYNMKMQGDPPPDPSNLQASNVSKDPDPGTTMSGVEFVPDKGSAGMRARVGIALVSGAGADAMNANVTLTAGIANGALSQLEIEGNIYVMTNSPTNDKATLKGWVNILYDLPQNKFSLAANVTGKLGTAELTVPLGIYAGPDGWFFKIGDAYGTRASFQLVDDSTVNYTLRIGANAYLGMGSLINPNLPPLPDKIASRVSRSPEVDALINQMDKTDGNGMMFGAQVNGTLRFSLSFIYANLDATLGFDLALKHFVDNFQCGGSSAGWENWYALGQMYFYFDVDAGVHVDCFLGKGDFHVASFTAAAVLSGGAPNPTWLDGEINVQGEVFDGLIKVDETAHFTIGEKCYPVSSPLNDINIISSYGPVETGDVFDAPYVASNVGLGDSYDVQVPPSKNHPNGETRTYRFTIDNLTVTNDGPADQKKDNFRMEYKNDNTIGIIKHDNTLLPYTNYTVTVVCKGEQLYGNNWGDPWDDESNQAKEYRQTVTWTFKTGPAPDYIPDKNVHFSYPVDNQRYVLKQEMNGNGKIELGQWQDNILSNSSKHSNAMISTAGGGFDYKLFFIPVGSTDTVKSTFTADESSRTLNYQIPATLKNNTVYRAEFWSLPVKGISSEVFKVLSKVSDSTLTMKVRSFNNSTRNENISAMIKKTTVAGPVKIAAELPKPIYVMYFATSQYNTLSEKLNGMGQWSGVKKGDFMWINAQNVPVEKFDEYEVKGFKAPDGTAYPPLFNAQIDWNNNLQNDQFAANNLYGPVYTLLSRGVKINFSVPELREMMSPVHTLDWSGFAYSPPLSLSETTPPLIYQALTANRQAPNLLGGVSNNASKSGSISTVSSAGFSFSFSQPAAASVGANKFNITSTMSMINVSMPMPYSLKWSRDYYIHQDYNLLRAFGLTAQDQAATILKQLDASQMVDFVISGAEVNFASNNIGGTVTMPWSVYYNLYNDPNSMNVLNKLKNLQFVSYPHGSRNITFRYRVGSLQGNAVNKTFNY